MQTHFSTQLIPSNEKWTFLKELTCVALTEALIFKIKVWWRTRVDEVKQMNKTGSPRRSNVLTHLHWLYHAFACDDGINLLLSCSIKFLLCASSFRLALQPQIPIGPHAWGDLDVQCDSNEDCTLWFLPRLRHIVPRLNIFKNLRFQIRHVVLASFSFQHRTIFLIRISNEDI